jgi:peptidoglycan/LPS O-acetylase OafA/YrhL
MIALDRYKNNFDLLRLLAAVFVIFSHSFPISSNSYAYEPLVNVTNKQISFGDFAVAIFFIVSGFLITQSYDRSQNIVYFFKARFFRIFPALIFVIALTTFVIGPVLSTLSVEAYFSNTQTYHYLSNILLYPISYYLPGVFEDNIFKGVVNGSLWTLAYECVCYILVGIMGILRILNKQFILILLLTLFCLSSMNTLPINDFVYKLIYLGCYFTSGMVLYMFRDQIKVSNLYVIISLIVVVISARYGGLVKIAIPLFGSYLLYFIAFHPRVKLHNVSKYGDFSYGLYIYAFPIQQFITYLYGGKMNPMENFTISLICSLICAFISWHIIEKHSLKLRHLKLRGYLFKTKSATESRVYH